LKAQLRRHNRAEVHDISVKKVFGIAGPFLFYRPEMKTARQTGGDLAGMFKLPELASLSTHIFLCFWIPWPKELFGKSMLKIRDPAGSVHYLGKSDRMMCQFIVDTTRSRCMDIAV